VCEFCSKHGEGKKWYLQAEHYAEDLLSDLERRAILYGYGHPEMLAERITEVGRLKQTGEFYAQRVTTPEDFERAKQMHFGQVVPIEDVEQILGMVTSIVCMACICRLSTVGPERRYCYGLSMAPQGGQFAQIMREVDQSYLTGPDSAGLEILTKDEALAAMRDLEQEGLCHTIWTYKTPYIGSICNCDADCGAFRMSYDMPTMFRAEYVSVVDPEPCNGCRQCMRVCQFGAITYSASVEKVLIDPRRCYGCGLCRASCTKDAITQYERSTIAAAANVWLPEDLSGS